MSKNHQPSSPERKLRTVTHFIKQWRKDRGLTVEQLALMANVSASMISQLERGRSAYTQDTLEAVAKALDLSPGTLLERDPCGNAGLSVSMGATEIVREEDLKAHLGEEHWEMLKALIQQTVGGLVSTMRHASEPHERGPD